MSMETMYGPRTSRPTWIMWFLHIHYWVVSGKEKKNLDFQHYPVKTSAVSEDYMESPNSHASPTVMRSSPHTRVSTEASNEYEILSPHRGSASLYLTKCYQKRHLKQRIQIRSRVSQHNIKCPCFNLFI